jgi:hypothetical protein
VQDGVAVKGLLMRNVVRGVEILIHFLLISLQPFPAVLCLYIYISFCLSHHTRYLSLSLYAFFRSFYQYSQQNRFNPLQRKTVLYRYIRTSHKTLTTTATQITYNLKIITSFLNSRKIFNINPTPTSSPVSLLISLYLFSSLLDISLKYSLLPD